jgi:hypothetical protein
LVNDLNPPAVKSTSRGSETHNSLPINALPPHTRKLVSKVNCISKTNIRRNWNFIEAASFQLYVEASRVRSFNGLRFYIPDVRFGIPEYNGQGYLAHDERVFTKKHRLHRSFESLN